MTPSNRWATRWASPGSESSESGTTNSLGVVLPKEVVQALHTAEGGTLHLTERPDGGYHLTPYDPDFERKMRHVEDIAARYRDTLRALSK